MQSCGAVVLVTLLYLSNLYCVVGYTFYIQININGYFINFIFLISGSVLSYAGMKKLIMPLREHSFLLAQMKGVSGKKYNEREIETTCDSLQ